jgi:hypothetical protein
MLKKNLFTFFLIFLFSLCTTTGSFATQRQKRKVSANYKTETNQPARASPADTTDYSVQINGSSNVVTLNGKIVPSTPDTTDKKNSIRVKGEGNTVSIIQTDHSSEVKITQKGKNNQVHVTQK